MALSLLNILHFRNIDNACLEFSPHINFIVGPNGCGKTSVLEAIYYLSRGRSFRTQLATRIIQYERPKLVLFGKIEDANTLELPLGVSRERSGKIEIQIGGVKGQRVAKLAQELPLQLINPEGFELITGGPKFRRAFIDWGMFYSQPKFYQIWQRIKRINKQRNVLLKAQADYSHIKIWDEELSNLTEEITRWRREYVIIIAQKVISICHSFLPEIELNFSFYQGWERHVPYKEYLIKHYARDMQLGYSFGGSHKADLKIKALGIPVEDILSRGQLKLLMCALRLAQGQYLTETTGKQCIYLIDDFASELDMSKRALLVQTLQNINAQVFVSCIHPKQMEEMYTSESKVFHVKHGKIILEK